MPKIKIKHPATTYGLVSLVLIAGCYWSVGAYSPNALPHYASSKREVIGMGLMLTFLPPYIIAAGVVIPRHSLALIDKLRPYLASYSDADPAVEAVQRGWRRNWPVGAGLGLLMGIANSPPSDAGANTVPLVEISFAVGQMILWLMVGILLAGQWSAARAFRRLGSVVHFDLLRLDRMKPLAGFGLSNVMAIAGAMVFVPLQSLDAAFRWYNYGSALMVAFIASIGLLVWPLWPIHLRIRASKDRRLEQIERLIGSEAAEPTADQVRGLEMLLAHRDRLRSQGTWLLSTDVVSRVLLYFVIPPMAWAGAALVERFIDSLFGS